MSNKVLFVVLIVAIAVIILFRSSEKAEEPQADAFHKAIQAAPSQSSEAINVKVVSGVESTEDSPSPAVETMEVLPTESPTLLKGADSVGGYNYSDPNKEILAKEKEHLEHAAELDAMRAFQYQGAPAQAVTEKVYADRPVD